jgi:hypothetical protein
MDDTTTDNVGYFIRIRGSVALDAWRALVGTDPDLEEVAYITAIQPVTRALLRVERPHSARWLTGPSELGVVFIYGKRSRIHAGAHYPDEGGMTSTLFREPDTRIVQKMRELAQRLATDVEVEEFRFDDDDEEENS